MTEKSMTGTHKADEIMDPAEWQQAYVASAVALGASWCNFMGARFQAYAQAIDDVSHCRDMDDVWQTQVAFGQRTIEAYSDEASRLGGLLMNAAKGETTDTQH